MMNCVYLGLGGNIGDTINILLHGLSLLEIEKKCSIISLSSPYKTPPWGKTDQPWFINACCCIKTTFELEELLCFCQKIEDKLQRKREEKWGARTIDIDLLALKNGAKYHSKNINLPHPFLMERPFVLKPLLEIAPSLIINGKSVAEWEKMNQDNRIEIVPSEKWRNFQKNIL